MASLSEKLRRERELRGISLKQISEDTKIGVRFLEALEEDKLELIPGEFYRRSYLRAYARYLGLDEDRAVNAYTFANQERGDDDEVDDARKRSSMAPWLPWVLAACALFIVVVLYLRSNVTPADDGGDANAPPPASMRNVANAATEDAMSSSAANSEPAVAELPPPMEAPALSPASTAVPVLTPSRSNPTSPSTDHAPDQAVHQADSQPMPGDGTLRFVVAVSESCWLEIEADGEIVTTGLKDEGYRRTFAADTEVRLWLGNAGGVSLWVNDRPLRSLGRAGQVRKDLSITPDNYLDYVSAVEGPS